MLMTRRFEALGDQAADGASIGCARDPLCGCFILHNVVSRGCDEILQKTPPQSGIITVL